MHDLWEGIVPFELENLLVQFIFIDEFLDLEFLNSRILAFNYGVIESKNRPSSLRPVRNRINIKESAAKTKCLFQFLPFFIGNKIPKNNRFWKIYLLLDEIVNIFSKTSASTIHNCINLLYSIAKKYK
jgi:hypothetical protein